jgi:DNA-binding transcriptional ArsR family regulator/YHS domain-containing protein
MYSQIFEAHADVLKALANPKRLEILNLLRDQTVNVNQMTEMLNLPQANLSQHLSILRAAKIVCTKKEGKEVHYFVAHPNYLIASDLIREILIGDIADKKTAKAMSSDFEKLLPIVHDPVCQMRLSPKIASYSTNYKNTNYYFCAEGCLEKFKSNPEKYHR